MTKIETKKDIEKRTKPTRHMASLLGSDDIEINSPEYINNLLKEAREKGSLHTVDRDLEDKNVRAGLEKAGILKFDKQTGIVQDARVDPKTEKKLLEFASRMTHGDRSLIVEMADGHFHVYDKEPTEDGVREYVYEFADYNDPKPKLMAEKKPKVEVGD